MSDIISDSINELIESKWKTKPNQVVVQRCAQPACRTSRRLDCYVETTTSLFLALIRLIARSKKNIRKQWMLLKGLNVFIQREMAN